MDDMDGLVTEFLVESHENLDRLDRDLLALEQDPRARDVLDSIFRTIHTIKGTCGFLGFSKLEKIAHVGENVLSRMREGALVFNSEIASVLLKMVDAIRTILSAIENAGNEGDGNYSILIENITRLQEIAAAAKSQAAAAPPPTGPAPAATVSPPAAAAPSTPEAVPVAAPPEPAPAAIASAPVTADVGQAIVTHALDATHDGATPASAHPEAAAKDAKAGSVSDSSIRVDVGLLDKLMNLVGELVLARNQILQYTSTQKDNAFIATTQRLNLITTELQESVMKTRMQPIGNVWAKFPRVVRDLANLVGKQIRIEMEGKETDLDKTIIEAIKDPLTHLVRNSVDHGIEAPDVRVAKGKAREGRLFLRAFHEGGQVNIEINDDGGGIDPEKVKRKAVQRGIITPDQAARMGEREAINLIFLPGFSTAEKVTNVSGRGVGMDVVKRNIERIGGTVDVQSRSGHGSTVRIKIPLTLAIIPALIVVSGGDRYAIPQVSLLELVRLEGSQAKAGIEIVHGTPVYRLRGHLLPLVDLNRQLGVGSNAAQEEVVNIVVLQADEKQFGLVVDSIWDTEEIVVKPLSKHLKGVEAFAGATIMGDGKVALILDVLGIARLGQVVSESSRDRGIIERAVAAPADAADRQTLLVCAVGGGRVAIPLSLVARLEELPSASIERSGEHEVVQYRNRILPLVRISSLLGVATEPQPSERLQVVVYDDQGHLVGLVVDRILDIVEEAVTVKAESMRRGIGATVVVQQKVTDLLDLERLLEGAELLASSAAAAGV